MVLRRHLTPELLRRLDPPARTEYWIADTQIRGFGVRVWLAGGNVSFGYAVRKSDPNGKSVRRSLNLGDLRVMHYNPADWAFELNQYAFFDRDLASFLPEARAWAKLEIAKITGKIESDETLALARLEDAEYRAKVGRYVSGLTLRHCVELVLKHRKVRGWTEEYEDRLRRAFNAFDEVTGAGQLPVGQLENGVLAERIEGAPIGFGTMRLLRSLLGVVADNIAALDGPRRWQLLPRRLEPYANPKEEGLEFLKSLELIDFERFLQGVRAIDASWQSKLSIELAFHLQAPFTRIRTGRWSHIVENRWYPYGAERRRAGYFVFENIDGPAAECLALAKRNAENAQIRSDYWFPTDGTSDQPIKNVDRTWKKALEQHEWPDVSLGFASKYFKRSFFGDTCPIG